MEAGRGRTWQVLPPAAGKNAAWHAHGALKHSLAKASTAQHSAAQRSAAHQIMRKRELWRVYMRGTGVRRMRSHPPVTSAKHVRFSSILQARREEYAETGCQKTVEEASVHSRPGSRPSCRPEE